MLPLGGRLSEGTVETLRGLRSERGRLLGINFLESYCIRGKMGIQKGSEGGVNAVRCRSSVPREMKPPPLGPRRPRGPLVSSLLKQESPQLYSEIWLLAPSRLSVCLVSLLTRKPKTRSFCVSRFTVNKKAQNFLVVRSFCVSRFTVNKKAQNCVSRFTVNKKARLDVLR